MKCPYCGKELEEGKTICDGCGATVGGSPVENRVNSTPTSFQQPTKNGNGKSGLLIVVVFLLIAGALTYFLLFSGESSNNELNNEQNNENNSNQENNVIDNSRKQAYADTAKAYVSAIKNEVLTGYLKFYQENVIFFVPVGGKDYCGNLESGGSSPYSDKWNYAYVGVVYDGEGFNYYFISEDASGVGIPLTPASDLSGERVYKDYKNTEITAEISSRLHSLYSISERTRVELTDDEILVNVIVPEGESVKKALFISAKAECDY